MKRVINMVVRIEYEQDDSCYWSDMPDAEKDATAISLAIQPNFHTVECGIELTNVQMHHADPEQPVDWYALENCPDMVFPKS